MSFLVPSDISQDDAEMQQWHKEKQQSLFQLQKAAEAHYTEHVAQKARRKVEAKAEEEAKRQRVAKEKKKKRTMEYLQQLWNKILEKEAALLEMERAEGSQVMGSKYKEIARDKKEQQFSKKTREKYRRGATAKMRDVNPCKRYVSTKQNCLVHSSR